MSDDARRDLIAANRLYVYTAHVGSVYDGDTVRCDVVDLGLWQQSINVTIRLYGINTPEVRGESRPAGLIVRDALRAVVLGEWVLIRTLLDRSGNARKGKYGRLLGEIMAPIEPDGPMVNINRWLVERHNVPVEGYGRAVTFTDPETLNVP